MSDLPTISLSRSALLGVLTTIQNSAAFAGQDILSFAGMCSTAEVVDHVQACFGRLTEADKVRALDELRRRVAPVSVAMVPQLVQQQQAQAGGRETAAEWAARMDRERPRSKPRPVREDGPAMKAALAAMREHGQRYAEAQIAARTEHDIVEAPALAGRYGRSA